MSIKNMQNGIVHQWWYFWCYIRLMVGCRWLNKFLAIFFIVQIFLMLGSKDSLTVCYLCYLIVMMISR